ncbi:hypothetical protein IAT40_005537 [Kwoniella sp. CBS 6097]
MKRSPSTSSLSPEMASTTPEPNDIKPLDLDTKAPPITPKKGSTTTKSAKASTPAKSPKKKVKTEGTTSLGTAAIEENGNWDAEKRALFMDTIISAGYMAVDLKELAVKLGMTHRQLVNRLQPGRSNFRSKAVAHIKGE